MANVTAIAASIDRRVYTKVSSLCEQVIDFNLKGLAQSSVL